LATRPRLLAGDGRRGGRIDFVDLLAARAPAEDGGEQAHR